MRRTKRGTVAVETFRGFLRLRWSYQGDRYTLSIGLPDSTVNRLPAESKARMIEGDIATGNFDPTLRKYKGQPAQQSPDIPIAQLLQQFGDYKVKRMPQMSLSKFKALRKPLSEFFGDKAAGAIDEQAADDFRIYLAKTLAPATQKERLITLNACWKWGIKQNLISCNPWASVVTMVKIPPTQKPKPFAQDEIRTILQGFRSDRHYCHYADFVEFLFSTGCRIGEAIGLKWKHLSDDCSNVWIGESVSRGKVRKATKTNRARQFRLTPQLQALLLSRRPSQWQGDDLVFPAPRGGLLDDHLFCLRAWTKTLTKVGVDYRHPYSCRHTFICHALASGMPPMAIAEMTGHDPQVLFKHYASYIGNGMQLPTLF